MLARTCFLGALVAAVVGACAVGCEPRLSGALYSCAEPEPGHKGPDGQPDPCHYQDPDGADAGEDAHPDPVCDVGVFAHWSFLWESPTLLWVGPEAQAPQCPQGPTTISFEGYADLVAPAVCEACTCEPPTGSCVLSSTLTASTAACNVPGGVTTSFDAPTPWDGSCDGTTKVPGGSARSVAITPMEIKENVCAAGPPAASKIVGLHWNTFALGCDVDMPKGPVNRSICLPDDLIEPGFALCIFRNGEHDCPDDPGTLFTERHIFYQSVQDDRQCSTCTCGPPVGSLCNGQLSLYQGNDLTCSGTTFAQIPLSSAQPSCLDIGLPNQALGESQPRRRRTFPVRARRRAATQAAAQSRPNPRRSAADPDEAQHRCDRFCSAWFSSRQRPSSSRRVGMSQGPRRARRRQVPAGRVGHQTAMA